MQSTLPLTLTFPNDLSLPLYKKPTVSQIPDDHNIGGYKEKDFYKTKTTYVQVRFPLTPTSPYASTRSRTTKSPEKLTEAIDLTDPSTSIGPRSSIELSDLILFFFLTEPPPPDDEEEACWPDEDEPAIIMGWSKDMICSYSYIVVVGVVAAGVVVVVVVVGVVVEGWGDGAVVVALDGEAPAMVMVGVGLGDGVGVVAVDVDADGESSVVKTAGCRSLFMSFEIQEARAPKVTSTVQLYDLIRHRNDTSTACPSCLTHPPRPTNTVEHE